MRHLINIIEGAGATDYRIQYHLSVEPDLVPMKTFAEQTRTVSQAGSRGESSGEGIYTTLNLRYWISQLAYEGVGEFPRYVYLVLVHDAPEDDPSIWSAHQDVSEPDRVTVLTILGDIGDADADMPDVGKLEFLAQRWLAANPLP